MSPTVRSSFKLCVPFLALAFLSLFPGSYSTPLVRASPGGEAMYKGFPMSLYRMCGSFHGEYCSPFARVPGPCLFKAECEAIACRPDLSGSCVVDPTAEGCEYIACDPASRKQREEKVKSQLPLSR